MNKLANALCGILFGLALAPLPAAAQSGCASIVTGAVLTAGQWNSCFSAKQNVLGYTPLNVAGGTMLGKLVTSATAAGGAGFNLPPGTAPTTPVDGDIWTTTASAFARINGVTVSLGGAPIGAFTVTSNSASALAAGANGATNPVIKVNANTASAATGWEMIGAAAAGGVRLNVISSGTNEGGAIDAKGSGAIAINGTATGNVSLAGGGGQVRVMGAAGAVNLTFASDNLSGFGSRAALEVNAYANSSEVMRWVQTQITAFSTLSAQNTLVSNVTRTIASAANAAWGDIQSTSTVTTLSGSTNVTSVFAKNQFFAPVITANAAALTITNSATVYIDGYPVPSGAGGFTPIISNPYSLYVNAGASFFGGALGIGTAASPTGSKWLGIAAGATGYSQINFAPSTAPTSPNDGDVWFETGSCLKLRVSGSNTTLCGGGGSTGSPYIGGSLGAVITASATTYVGPGSGIATNAATATEADVQSAVTRTATAKNLTVKTRAAQSGTGNLVVTVRKNGVDTAITLTIAAGAAAGTFSDLVNTAAFTQLDLLSVKLVNNASAAGPGLSFALEYD